MTRKATTKGPVVFAEWVIGGPIIPIRAKKAKAKKKGPTEVITVKVTADDDNDTDTLHVTYPRSRRIAPEADGGEAKKVHFDKGLSKSALKNGKTQATSKGSDTDSTAVASSDTSGDETTDASSDDESSKASKDSCNCCRCIKRHRKHTKCTKEAESSADEAAESKCTKCGNKAKAEEDDKTKKKTDTENKKDKDKDKDDKNDKTNDKSKNKNKDKDKATEDKGAEDKAEEKSDTEAAKDKDKKNEKGKEKETKNADTSEAKSSKSKDKEPEKLPLHAPGKAPNLIAPIRAQVVQTEAVIEDSQDPRPNAFYDAAHNIMRVYYGPVYGNHDNRSLYPRHDATGLPLHLGMPYPPHHPYFYGFKDGPPAPSPMTGYPLPPHLAHADTGSHRGAFSKPPSVHDDIAGRNNVVPVPTTASTPSLHFYRLILTCRIDAAQDKPVLQQQQTTHQVRVCRFFFSTRQPEPRPSEAAIPCSSAAVRASRTWMGRQQYHCRCSG